MTVQEYRDHIAAGKPVENGSEAHLLMHEMSQEALRITMEINNKYHTPEGLRKLLAELWGHEVPESIEDKVWLGANVTILEPLLGAYLQNSSKTYS